MQSNAAVAAKRVYAKPDANDGHRVLVDRLWPRGVTKEAASIDTWLKDIAPSTALRSWFNHIPERWPHFLRRYRLEVQTNPATKQAFDELLKIIRKQKVTLVFSAKDERHNNAIALFKFLSEHQATTSKAPIRNSHRR